MTGVPLDRITLTGLRARGFHGVLATEREEGQEFGADVVLHLDTRAAAAGDDLTATVNYAEVAQDVVDVLAGPPVDLIETVAATIADRVLRHPRVEAVDVTVHKPHAPIPVPFADVTVHVHRRACAASVDGTADEDDAVSGGAASDEDDAASDGAASDDDAVSGGAASDEDAAVSGGAASDEDAAAAVDVVLALGANLGDARAALGAALTQLGRHPRVTVQAVSPLLRSAAVVLPGAPPQPDYLNAVAVLRTNLPPRELLALCQGIELAHGRVRAERWGARPLDLDLVAAGSLTWQDADLTLPHPRAHERSFVLAPWARIAPDAVLPGHGPVAVLAAEAGDDARWVAEDWWEGG